jgi:hypothetical protein
MPPIARVRRGEPANQSRAVPAANAHTLSSSSAVTGVDHRGFSGGPVH